MTSASLRLFRSTAAVMLVVAVAHAAEPAIIAKARAFLGPEATLNGVRSIHYTGTLVLTSSTEPGKEQRAALEIIFQKSDQQRIQSTAPQLNEVTAIDGYDAWQRRTDPVDHSKWEQTHLGVDQIKRLRANTVENLSFFRPPPSRGVVIEERGSASFDGVDCVKVAFVHDPGIVFYRYFDKATGRLVYTETEAGNSIREQGEITAGGVRFPKTIITTTKAANNQTQTVTITFDKITLNEVFPSDLFSPPVLLAK